MAQISDRGFEQKYRTRLELGPHFAGTISGLSSACNREWAFAIENCRCTEGWAQGHCTKFRENDTGPPPPASGSTRGLGSEFRRASAANRAPTPASTSTERG